jgi:SulP family sulfate permease
VLSGLLLFLGASMLYDWLVRTHRKLSPGDYAIVLLILVCIVNMGYLQGALVGIIAASVMFVVRYSRIRTVKHRLTAGEYASYVERSNDDRRLLNEHGERIVVFKLQGYLFFGTANSLFEEVREAVLESPRGAGHTVILDFRLVSGSDSSAVFSFVKLLHLLDEQGTRLCLSGVSAELHRMLDSEGVVGNGPGKALVFQSLDQALEIAEESLLHGVRDSREEAQSLHEWLEAELQDAQITDRIIPYLQRLEVKSGDSVCRQGEASDEIYLAVSGRISIILKSSPREEIRLRTMASRTMVGEMGFFRGAIRAASVVADQTTVLYCLSRSSFERMRTEDPAACNSFQELVIRVLSNRLEFANSEVSALQR